MSRVRWGILGSGRIAHQFVEDFQYVTNGEVVAVGSRGHDTAKAFAERHRISRAHGSYADLFDDPGVDAIYIATPHTAHFANTRDALRAGKHVLCEKPFTVDARECQGLIEQAKRTRLFMMEAMWTWFLPAIRTALDWVAEGRIGQLRQIKADFGYPLLPFDPERREYKAELAGGCLLEMGIYPVALALLFLQRDPDDMQVIARRAPNGVEDDVQMLFNYGDNDTGCSATLATSFRSKLQNSAYVIGEDCYIEIPDFFRARECRLYHLDECVDRFHDPRDSHGFNYEASAASRDILDGRQQSTIVTWQDSLRFQQHMDRVRERM